MCSSVSTEGHVFVDARVFSDSDENGQYVDGNGQRRQWQRCIGCGNVRSRQVKRFYQVKPAYFRKHFENARENERIREATSEFTGAFRGTRYFIWENGFQVAGYAIRADGELVYVFSTARGLGSAIVADAIQRGATHLDCFDGYLPTFYAENGFIDYKREANWTPGGPDVVYMQLNVTGPRS